MAQPSCAGEPFAQGPLIQLHSSFLFAGNHFKNITASTLEGGSTVGVPVYRLTAVYPTNGA
jgi:hypothetical protein